jgi:hypothetical protein
MVPSARAAGLIVAEEEDADGRSMEIHNSDHQRSDCTTASGYTLRTARLHRLPGQAALPALELVAPEARV